MSQTRRQSVLIVDYGSQVTQLIARRVRESGVYCEIHPFDRVDAVLEDFSPDAVILSGDVGRHGIADLRPGAPDEDPELRRLMVGRAAKLERLALAKQIAPGCWTH